MDEYGWSGWKWRKGINVDESEHNCMFMDENEKAWIRWMSGWKLLKEDKSC